LLAAASVARARGIIKGGDYDADLAAVVVAYVRRLRSDIFAATGTATIRLAAALYEQANSGRVSWVSYAAVSALILMYSAAFSSHARTRLSFVTAMNLTTESGEGTG
jgi:hypothetical protein